MCGIAGFIDYTGQSTETVLKEMTDTLEHRGPDGSGYEVYNNVIGLGHRRLSILDLSQGGHQPMPFNNYRITFNGEVYNFGEIKDSLIKLGHTFTSGSDTEMILHAFQEWGISCIDRFIGMFAFVLFDSSKGEVYCVRDRAGVKPFFYYWKDDLFLFGSELKALLKHPLFVRKVDLNAVAAYMQYGYVPTPNCIWQDTKKIRPGHYLKISLNTKEVTENRYWNVYDSYNKPTLDIGFEEAKKETKKILTSACNYRMISDVPVGVFLSGGYDSTTVAAMLQKDRTEKIKTFTIGVPDAGLNEAPYAKAIAEHLGTDHTEYYCTEKEALEMVHKLPFFYDEPFADSSAIPTSLVSKIAKKDVTVALSADAGDEVFAGYNRYHYLSQYGKSLNRIPGFARSGLSKLMNLVSADSVPVLRNKYVFHNRYEKLKSLLVDPSVKNMLLSLSQQYNDSKVNDLMLHDVKELDTMFVSDELAEKYWSDLSYMLAVDYQTYLLDDILQKVDRATMSVGLEGREPFLDQRIIEWAAQLPNDFKYFKGIKKYILREINKEYIPSKLMDRPKMGFGIPIEKWLMVELKDVVYDFCNQDSIVSQAIFNPTVVEKLLTDFYGGKKELGSKVWYLLMFQMWYRAYAC